MNNKQLIILLTLSPLIITSTISASMPKPQSTASRLTASVTQIAALAAHKKQEADSASCTALVCANPTLHAQERATEQAIASHITAHTPLLTDLSQVVVSYLPLRLQWNTIDMLPAITSNPGDYCKGFDALAQIDDHTIVSWHTSGTLIVHDMPQKTQQSMEGHKFMCGEGIIVLPNGNLLSIENNGTCLQWDMKTKKQLCRLGNDVDRGAVHLALLPNGDVLGATWGGSVTVWDTNTGVAKQRKQIVEGDDFALISFEIDDGVIIMREQFTKDIMLWNMSDDSVHSMQGHPGHVSALKKLPNNELASGDREGNIFIWDLATRTIKQKFKQKRGVLPSLVALPDGDLISGSWESPVITVWDRAKSQAKLTMTCNSRGVKHLSLTLEGDLISGDQNGAIIIWDIKTGTKKYQVNPAGQFMVHRMLLMHNGDIVAGFADGALKRWQPGKCQACTQQKNNTGK